ncbi:recombinase family protein [Paracidovorax oryzae]|uniref:recombinase family protein n=1 Tax=Paracidovorax oryzae TaxID=862720 RepID=UPI0002EC4DB9|nr:recombinase family protein [Paracidovorax oryzae]
MKTPLSDATAAGMQRVFAYARVSTVEQLTENQREQIARAGYQIAPKRFIEEQISGSVPAAQRPGFQRLLERTDEGDTLVVTKLDRIGLDSIDVFTRPASPSWYRHRLCGPGENDKFRTAVEA